jgi:hypothetical protein
MNHRRTFFLWLAAATPTLVVLGGRALGAEPWGTSGSLEGTLDNITSYLFNTVRLPATALAFVAGCYCFFVKRDGKVMAMWMWAGALLIGMAPFFMSLVRQFTGAAAGPQP